MQSLIFLLQLKAVDLKYYKFWNITGLHRQGAEQYRLENLSLCQKLNSFLL